jgi:uncharacterized protein YecT (DUF1311 family)
MKATVPALVVGLAWAAPWSIRAGNDAAAPPGKPTDAPPAAVLGTWDVEKVAVDLQDQMHWDYRPDDPQYLHRTLTIDAQGIRFNGSNYACKQARWQARQVTWGTLLAKGFPRPTNGGRKAIPTPRDFELPVATGTTLVAYQLCPSLEPKAAFPASAWLAVQGPDSLALRMDASGLMILKRRPPGARPRASFPCEKATTVTEKALCADFALAAWDRSVALAFRQASGRRSAGSDLVDEQKAWLKKRDACGANSECLETEMFQRVTELSQ